MSIKIQTVDLRRDREVIIKTLGRFLTSSADEKRFEWLYGQNPHGETCGWLALDDADNSVIGAAAAFSRRFLVGKNETVGWVLGDFCLDPRYRTLGPALRLQQSCLDVLNQTEGGFCYDFPSASMTAVYKRLGYDMTGKTLRLAKPLRIDRKIKEIIKNPAAQRVVASVGNALLKIELPRGDIGGSLWVSLHRGPCDDEFTALADSQRDHLGICLRRSAEYLNWRYVNNRLAEHQIIVARRAGRLVGYVVWMQSGEDASIVDMLGEIDTVMMRRLIAEVMTVARKHNVITLSVSLNEAHPWLPLFSALGFRVRDSVPVIIIPSKSFAGKMDSTLTGWYLMQGDRDS